MRASVGRTSPVTASEGVLEVREVAEVYIGEEYIGTLTRDEDDDDLSYSFTMSILEYDLNGGAD